MPLLVVGSLRGGGGGKTPIVTWLASRFPGAALLVHPTPDEQGNLEAAFPGRVLAGSSFPRLWRRARDLGFALGICDGGFQDPRLDGAVRLLVVDEPLAEDFASLHPFGPWRERADAAARADLLLVRSGTELAACRLGVPRWEYRWRCAWPPELRVGPVLMACGIGNPARFQEDLETFGATVLSSHVVSDHGAFDLKEIRRIEAGFPGVPWVGTAKDAPRWPDSAPRLHVVRRDWVPSEEDSLLCALAKALAAVSSGTGAGAGADSGGTVTFP